MTITTPPLALDAAPIPDAGLGALSTERGNLPLDAVDVRAVITGLTAGVEVTQGFHNPFDAPHCETSRAQVAALTLTRRVRRRSQIREARGPRTIGKVAFSRQRLESSP